MGIAIKLRTMLAGMGVTSGEINALDMAYTHIRDAELKKPTDEEVIKEKRCYFVGMLKMLVATGKVLPEKAEEIINFVSNMLMTGKEIEDAYNGKITVRFKKFEPLPLLQEPLREGKIPVEPKIGLVDYVRMPQPKRILKNGPATIVFWDTGDKTIVKLRPGDTDNPYAAFTAALAKKIYGNNSKVNRVIKKTEGK